MDFDARVNKLKKEDRDGSPTPCDNKLFQEGHMAGVVAGPPSFMVEAWVQMIAKKAKAPVDWHYAGGRGRGRILCYEKDLKRVRLMARWLEPVLIVAYHETHPEDREFRPYAEAESE